MSALSRSLKSAKAKRAGQTLAETSSDWAWRPPLWTDAASTALLDTPQSGARMNIGTTVHHDAQIPALTLSQQASEHPAFALSVQCNGFDGSYLSIATDLAPAVVTGLTKQHILTCSIEMTCAEPLPVYGRLNIRQGPNVLQLSQEVNDAEIAFDLAYSDLNEARVEKLWLDLIFDRPALAEITLTDMVFRRHLRLPL